MALRCANPVNNKKPKRSLPSLRWYLLTCFAACAILMVVAYTQLLEYYLDVGINIRTQATLERTAIEYQQEMSNGVGPAFFNRRSMAAYRSLNDIPLNLLEVFPIDDLRHGELIRYVNLVFDDDQGGDEPRYRVDTQDLCTQDMCELVFLYPYMLPDGQWLYLIHGVVASDEIYTELELTEQVAFAIGGLFAALLILVSFLVVRSIDTPLRKLVRWSAEQSVDSADTDVPDLRFRELDGLARRLRSAFDRMREGVNKEKLFLRHASHELRTPIAILASNVELMDRLTDRSERSEELTASFLRQYRALEDVQLLIETLLWINRQSDQLPKSEPIDLHQELQTIVDSYRYLIDARAVTLKLEGAGANILAPVAAVRIVLSNLVRNAFQHSIDGEVLISIEPARVTIENASAAKSQPPMGADSHDDGFGLGLELVNLICDRFGWHCTSTDDPRGWKTAVRF